MAKDHGSSIKNDKKYEGLRKHGMSKARAAAISNSPGASKRGGEHSHGGKGKKKSSTSSSSSSRGTKSSSRTSTRSKKAKAGRKGGRKSHSKK